MFKETLPAGESREYRASGSWVRVDSGSKVLIVTENGERAPLKGRDSVQFKSFNLITITNQSNQDEEIELRVSGGRIVAAGDESVVRISDAANSVNVENAAEIGEAVTFGGTINVGGVTIDNAVELAVDQIGIADKADVPVSVGQTVEVTPVNASRREVIIQALSDQETKLRIGSATVAAGRGLVLVAAPGVLASITLKTTAAVHVFNESGGAAGISVLEVTK